ncbi:MAG TPA: hypothetical protein PLA50_14130, partial [Bacteroidia bacterium]|nr:hypothetical protein [Bacteroidia bacterium]
EASASVGSGGRVLIEAAYAKVDGQIKAEGGHVRIAATEKADLGGSIDVSDPSALSDSSDLSVIVESREISVGSTAAIDASGATGGGSINIGGGFQGRDVTIRNAESLVIDDGATIRADALTSGNGGQVILWSGGDTTFRGSISAQALGNGGNGGFVEVSGKEGLLYDGTVSTLAANGRSGTLLLDPSDFSIVVSGAGPNSMTSADLIAALNTTGSMVISTSGTGGTGDITVEAGANVNWNSANSLSLLAHRHIVVGANIQNSGSGGINLVAGWDGTTMPTSFPAASYGDLNGTITISGAAVGSRMGHTFAAGYRMELIGGSAAARLGYYDTGSNAINGAITANLKSGGLTLQGGSATGSAAQIGHVGQSNAAATTGGAINVDVTGIGAIALTGGTGEDSYAQIGHGARANTATKSGNISVTTASGGLELKAGGTVASSGQGAHALIGHGGRDSTNTIANSNITVDIGGSIGITAGVSGTAVNRHAQIGHGGLASSGTFSGIIDVKSGGNITLQGGNTGYAYAQIGHGGRNGSGSHSGEIKVFAQGSVRGYTSTLAGGNDAWAMIGHGGRQTVPATVGTGHGGDITVTAQTGNIDFKGGLAEGNVARIGHGGGNSQGDFWGRIVVNAATGISFTGGGGTNAYAQIGHGGAYSNGVNYTGNITGQIDIALTTAANTGIHLAGGSGGGSYAKIGHGGFHNATDTSNGSITGGIFVNYDSVGDVATGFAGRINLQGSGINSFAQIGHGGTNRRGNMAGDVILGRVGDVELKGSTGAGSFAHIGHGGVAPNAAVLGGKITVNAAGNVALLAGNSTSAAYAMIGHGGGLSYGDKSGDISVTSSAGTLFRIVGGGGNDNFAMIGHGGLRGDATNKGGNTIGNIVVQATNASLTMTGGASGSRNFVKIGHGGYMGDVDVNSTLQGSINATFGGNAEIRGGGGVSFAQVGHGSVYANYTDANDPNYS